MTHKPASPFVHILPARLIPPFRKRIKAAPSKHVVDRRDPEGFSTMIREYRLQRLRTKADLPPDARTP